MLLMQNIDQWPVAENAGYVDQWLNCNFRHDIDVEQIIRIHHLILQYACLTGQ
jgi:hypothetical protein